MAAVGGEDVGGGGDAPSPMSREERLLDILLKNGIVRRNICVL